ncbi:hypothetical protein OSX66_02880 [Staphylococcus agnetis]|uniref:Thioredoxin n=1 Tax=Staphylococcus agnetis TaxID=985762 RepID=A0ABD7TSE6_9STAP|nr:hypothetical protein [Staphylococcus agnetis]MDG4942828.1 hypothetical protein [Staphylococcus agnetis]UXU57078.1 hypothetical protein MUA95_11040 [Staphylococcus agnetis]
MVYLIIFIFIFLILIQAHINRTNKKMILEQTGLPISSHIIIDEKHRKYNENIYICLSTQCSICKKILFDFQKESKKNTFLVFTENKNVVNELITEMNIKINSNKIIYEVPEENLFLFVTPFVYITNKEGIIIKKKVINNIRELQS